MLLRCKLEDTIHFSSEGPSPPEAEPSASHPQGQLKQHRLHPVPPGEIGTVPSPDGDTQHCSGSRGSAFWHFVGAELRSVELGNCVELLWNLCQIQMKRSYGRFESSMWKVNLRQPKQTQTKLHHKTGSQLLMAKLVMLSSPGFTSLMHRRPGLSPGHRNQLIWGESHISKQLTPSMTIKQLQKIYGPLKSSNLASFPLRFRLLKQFWDWFTGHFMYR
jgi:hypothetical protein